MYRSPPGAAIPERPAGKIAAVAESAATTRCRDDPKTANATAGSINVYRPETIGVPAIRV
jgi:hypothetical protein